MSSSTSYADTSADSAEIEDEEMTVDSSSENDGKIVREVGCIEEEGKAETAIIEREDQPASSVELSSYENNEDVEADLVDIETVYDDVLVTGASSIIVYEGNALHEDLSIEDKIVDGENDRGEDGGEEDRAEDNAEEEALNEEDEWERAETPEDYDAEQ